MCDTWLVHMCDTWLVHMCDTWLVYMCDIWLVCMWNIWLVHMCDIPHSHTRVWLVRVRDTFVCATRSCARHDTLHYTLEYSFVCVTWHTHTRVHLWLYTAMQRKSTYYTWFIHMCDTWRIHMCDTPHAYTWCDSSVCVTLHPHTRVRLWLLYSL